MNPVPLIATLFLLLFWTSGLSAQNLVINGGHEDFTPFPSVSVPFDSCIRELGAAAIPQPSNFPPNPQGIGAACATPDHRCTAPRTGKAHGGYFHYTPGKFENPEYRLCAPIRLGERYAVSGWFRLSKESGLACDRIGFWFTDWGYFTTMPQIKEDPDHITPQGVFLDSKDYERISFTWTANTDADALVIGNFLSPAHPGGSSVKKLAGGGSEFAYYELDDVEIRPLPRLVGPDTVCAGQEAVWFLANRPPCSSPPVVTWLVSDADTSFQVVGDTLLLAVVRPTSITVLLPEDTLSAQLAVKTPDSNFTWAERHFLCPDDSLLLDAGFSGKATSHVWSTGESSPRITVTELGAHSVNFNDGICHYTLTTMVIPLPELKDPDWPDTLFLCPGDTAFLASEGGSSFLWSIGQSIPADTITLSAPGSYQIMAVPDPCDGTWFHSVQILEQIDLFPEKSRIPNLFTPNGDGTNDRFIIPGAEGLSAFSMIIFNRWGREVFRSTNPLTGWDGTFNGSDLPMDTYAYVLEVQGSVCGTSRNRTIRGEITLLR